MLPQRLETIIDLTTKFHNLSSYRLRHTRATVTHTLMLARLYYFMYLDFGVWHEKSKLRT